MRNNGSYTDAPTYVAVRQMPKPRYVAVRNYDYDNAPQYVAVRRRPTYVDMDPKYALMRNNYVRTRYVTVRDRDNMDDYDYVPTQYVAVRNVPETRYVAVRNISSDHAYDMRPTAFIPVPHSNYDDRPIGYVPVLASACGCSMSSLQNEEPVSLRHVVVRNDYVDGTEAVVYPQDYEMADFDDMANVVVRGRTQTMYNVGRFHNDGSAIVPVTYAETGNLSYVPASYDNNVDDQATLDTHNVTYVAANDIDDACLSPVSVSYFTGDEVDNYQSVNYVPATNVEYISAEPVSYVPNENVTYVRTKRGHVRSVSFVPTENVDYVNTVNMDSCECPVSENGVVKEIVQTDHVADTSAEVEDNNNDMPVDTISATTVMNDNPAGENGYRDGFEDGKQAALNGNEYKPANSSGSQDADNGYDRSFGSKDAYAYTYRNSYLKGYRAGFGSGSRSD